MLVIIMTKTIEHCMKLLFTKVLSLALCCPPPMWILQCSCLLLISLRCICFTFPYI